MSEAALEDSQAKNDSAWASVNTPLSAAELKIFCKDIVRLFRINPMLEFKETKSLGDHKYFFSGLNISQEKPFEFATGLSVRETENGFEINYDEGMKTGTSLLIEASDVGSKLTITDFYGRLSESERKSRLGEVDKSLVNWAEYIQRFILMWKRWSRLGLWRWYMHAVWQPMKPTARRITYMIWWITLVEISLITLGAAIYFVEYA